MTGNSRAATLERAPDSGAASRAAGATLAFGPFSDRPANHRVVAIPERLSADARSKFVARVAAAVRQQAGLAARNDCVLRVAGDARERDGRILIPHEPASPLLASRVVSADSLPDVQTLIWIAIRTLSALKLAAAEGAPHGGIVLESLYCDESGRVKLGDFGIAPAFETVCGLDSRRQIHCASDVRDDRDGPCTGVWALLGEDASRDSGWIAPYFGHELLEGKLRLNPKSDQFALGAALFLLGTGTHPYGVELSDPTMTLYYHLEPFAAQDERKEWGAVFERHAKQLAGAADRPILAWAELVSTLLASDPGARFANPGDAEKLIEEFVPSFWHEASATLEQANERLAEGDAEGFLSRVGPLREDARLPSLWRERLAPRYEHVASERKIIGRRKQLERQIEEGHTLLEQLEFNRARQVAEQARSAPEADDSIRAAAEQLLTQCEEQELLIRTGADAIARSYLSAARESMERDELDDARRIVDALLADANTPESFAQEARALLAEIELTGRRVETQINELSAATDDVRFGRYAAAQQRLESLLSEPNVPEAARTQAALMIEEVRQRQAERAEVSRLLEEARAAWERADLETLRARLARVPVDFEELSIAEARNDLFERAARLESAQRAQAVAQKALQSGDLHEAVQVAERALSVDDLPETARDELRQIERRARVALEEARQAGITAAISALAQAQHALESDDVSACRGILEQRVLSEIALPDDARRRGELLLEQCRRIDALRVALDRVRELLHADKLDAASRELDALDTQDASPAALSAEKALRDELTARVAERARRRLEAAGARITEAEADLASGRLDSADAALAETRSLKDLPDELRKRTSRATEVLARLREFAAALDRADDLLASGVVERKRLDAALKGIPEDCPAWVSARIDKIHKSAQDASERRRRESLAAAAKLLDAAEQAVEEGRAEDAQSALRKLADAELDARGVERREATGRQLQRLEKHAPAVRALSGALEKGDIAAALRDSAALLKGDELPAALRREAERVRGEAASRVEARRKEVAALLEALDRDLSARGRKSKDFAARCAALTADALATKEQRASADALAKRFEALPVPKPSKMPIFVAGGVGVVAIIVVVAMLIPSGGSGSGSGGGSTVTNPNGSGGGNAGIVTPQPEPKPEPEPEPQPPAKSLAEKLSDAQTAITASAEAARQAADSLQRPAPRYSIRIEPRDRLPAKVFARPPSGAEIEIGTIQDEAAIASPALRTGWEAMLYPPPAEEPPEPEPDPQPSDPDTKPDDTPPQPEPEPEPEPPAIPTLEEAVGAFLSTLTPKLQAGVTDARVEQGLDGELELTADAGGAAMLPFTAISFDAGTGQLRADADAAARFLNAQAEALIALARPDGLSLRVSAAYDGKLALNAGAQLAEVASDGVVQIRGTARLSADPRAEAFFALTGAIQRGVVTADEDTQRQFETYLAGLQAAQAAAAQRDFAAALSLPAPFELRCPSDFAGGDRLVCSAAAGDATLSEVAFSWNADTLQYLAPTAEEVLQSVQSAVRELATRESSLTALRDSWAAARGAISVPDSAPGIEFWNSVAVRGIALRDPDDAAPGRVNITATLGPPDDSAATIQLEATIDFAAGGFTWNRDSLAAAATRDAVVSKLAAFAPAEPEPKPEPKPEPEPAPAGPDELLNQLAAKGAISADEMVSALRTIATAKADKYQIPRLRPSQNLDQGGAAALAALTTSLQNLAAAGDRNRNPFPTVFVEYYVGEQHVYALSWRAPGAVEGLAVRQVMPRSRLDSGFASASAARQTVRDAALGEALLGTCLGGALQGSGGGSGSFGVLVAPDERLWLTRWDQVAFSSRSMNGVDLREALVPQGITSLRDILRDTPAPGGKRNARVGLWCVPSLGATVPARNWTIELGPIGDGGAQLRLLPNSSAGGLSHCVLSTTRSDTHVGDYNQAAGKWPAGALGFEFWNRGWKGDTFDGADSSIVTFSLVPTAR